MTRVVVIGAGVGGLTTAARLAKLGLNVTVLESHIYPGGCAGTFYHRGYRFDAGATLAGGFYPGGPMELVAQAASVERWPARPAEPAMVVHLPGGMTVTRWAGLRRRAERRAAFGPHADSFWRWQEQTADALWDLALRLPPWPPQSPTEGARLAKRGAAWLAADWRRLHPQLALDALRPVARRLKNAPRSLRQFVDAQLLIAAQTTSKSANALYGASALDLPRRGVVHLNGGMGAIAATLADTVQRHGGRVIYRQTATRIVLENGRPVAVESRQRQRPESFPADVVVANLPPASIARLLGSHAPRKMQNLSPHPNDGWGAFTVYAGIDAGVVPPDFPLHHQVIAGEPLGEGNTVFLSLSPGWDAGRAPQGRRALTLSTHTQLGPWWQLFENDPAAYEVRKMEVARRLLHTAETALPGLRDAVQLTLPGTPVTFQRFTGRLRGWVGGFPQTDLFRAWGPRLAPGVWMVGDSIFPGQSTAAVALGGLRVAESILAAKAGGGAERRVSSATEPAAPGQRFRQK